ncbi:hypothetical protein PFICI_04101 [Pestalotiopsis fici W106-1]|uniref:Xylanolytic transcriptional activator regulatory domain-containing protein n=1 Tax=Pestalotiopsis fici (strain W106-1 / CGMCC3.15140) TaxID=1229662 RepID=W3XLD3_PESFW|nr:uncharacterized protein PFICI_04101 [Pestalotiopsis fici W106-1]ETS86076.1 hypothetical protein PFICI_04101 [Pestalotiopsis fici W106-1]
MVQEEVTKARRVKRVAKRRQNARVHGHALTAPDTKAKPGMRTGAIENLNQRLVSLEKMFLGQGVLWQQVWKCLDSVSSQKHHDFTDDGASLPEYTAQLKASLSALHSDNKEHTLRADEPASLPKRRKLNGESDFQRSDPFWMKDGELCLPQDLVDSLVEIYFLRIQPWIPILHVRLFPEAMKVPLERRKMKTIFHAIASLCVRFSDDPRLASPDIRSRLGKQCRQAVILESMESFSVENLQALIICAFDMIGSGRGPSAWSIVGSIARTVEHLQLNVEEEDRYHYGPDKKALITRIAFLPPCVNWAAAEGRRRVFWNVFLMDRFCSIATGWNMSLKSTEVKRRLPCEGALWEAGEPLSIPTPYFGTVEGPTGENSDPLGVIAADEETSSLGAFSYCIEATESLGLVTTFFQEKSMDIHNPQALRLWLIRFKQLDLRLMQWKIFLPVRWREACAVNADGNMDPNLTLAHITHNTAVVLLHQSIAYPTLEWQSSPIRLPSSSSAETCLAAAREVGIIAQKFLRSAGFVTNPQFAFCLFICGRMLLAHSATYNMNLIQEFESLLGSLWEIARRWNGPHVSDTAPSPDDNLASKLAHRLFKARQLGPHDLDLTQSAFVDNETQTSRVRFTGSLTGQSPDQTLGVGIASPTKNCHYPMAPAVSTEGQGTPPDMISLAFPPLPMAFQVPSASQTAMHSPNINSLEHYPNQSAEAYAQQYPVGFEDLHSLLEDPFLPNQRVSVFSHPIMADEMESMGQ